MLRAKWEDRGSLALSLVHKAVLLLQQAPNNTLWEKEHFPCTSEKVSNIWASVSFWFFFFFLKGVEPNDPLHPLQLDYPL